MTSKQQARELYFTQNLSQREIAQQVGVSERTVYTWVHQYAWNKLRVAALSAPITMVDNFSSALVELQNAIAARKPGERYPTPKEAEVSRKHHFPEEIQLPGPEHADDDRLPRLRPPLQPPVLRAVGILCG